MPKFTALVHVEESTPTLEATLKSASLSDDLLVVLDSEDKPLKRMIRKSRGRVKTTIPGVSPGAYAMDSYYDWVLVLRPGEVLDKRTATVLEEWKNQEEDELPGHRVGLLRDGRHMETLRLINRQKINWTGELPPDSQNIPLIGDSKGQQEAA